MKVCVVNNFKNMGVGTYPHVEVTVGVCGFNDMTCPVKSHICDKRGRD